jgi:two-component system C4-dicarboxylate transport response regulator DctD
VPLPKVILVEDEEELRIATEQTLELGGFETLSCSTAETGYSWLDRRFNGVVVTDVKLPCKSGLDLLRDVIELDPDIPVILVTGHGDVHMAVEAMRIGAYDFVEKPFPSERLLTAVQRAFEKRSLVTENRQLRAAQSTRLEGPALIGESKELERVRRQVESLGPTSVDILINGETGTGKEVVARQLHVISGRKGPFVAINCGGLPESIFESEMFGHEAGAYTGAQKRRIGKLEFASGGTVFLDEIESMPMPLQIKLLRVLQERRLERLGGNHLIAFDCRVIAATKADLLSLSAEGKFRADLFYRIGVVTIDLPRLAERRDDIPLLLGHFVKEASVRFGRPVPEWGPNEVREWQSRDWPGNVRELRNFAERLVLGVERRYPDASEQVSINLNRYVDLHEGSTSSLHEKIDAYEKKLIIEALERCKEKVADAAALLEIPKKTLYDKMKRLGVWPK